MKDLQTIPNTIEKLLGDSTAGKLMIAILTGAVGFVFPTTVLVNAGWSALGLIVLDTVTGTWAAAATGKKITSSAFSRVITKVLGYLIACVALTLGFRAVPGLEVLQQAAVASTLAMVVVTELISICENLERVGIWLPGWIKAALHERENALRDDVQSPAKDPAKG